MMRRLTRLKSMLLLVGLFAFPLFALGAAQCGSSDRLDVLESDAEPILGTLTERTILDEKRVTITLTWERGAPLRAPSWSGIVTSVAVEPGSVLATGSPVVEVSGITRLAAASPAPFYRPLEAGDSGKDAEQLNGLLVALGHLDAEDAEAAGAEVTFATASAVERFAEAIGAEGRVFDPAWVLWLPGPEYRLGTVAVTVGAPAPAPGAEVAAEAGALVSASLAAANPGESLSLDPAVEWVAVLQDGRYPVDATGPAIAAESLSALAAVLPEAPERVDGSVQRARELDVFALPSSAVAAGERGGLCIWMLEGEQYRAVPVQALSARAGVTNIARSDGLTTQTAVLANPSQVLEAPQCP